MPGGAAVAPVRAPFRCVERAEVTAAGLLVEAEAALDAGQAERALGCADEALRAEPRSVRGLTARGEALAALDRVKEAQLAFTRALAVDPEDAAALAGAAELHVRRLEGAHDALEAGVELALRGLRALTRVPRREPGLRLRLELAAATGLSDLGRATEALPHAQRAVALGGEDPAASNEHGFALFELCRFDEARRAFERTLAVAAEDPWALHHLGLLAERRGDQAEAARLLSRARELSPADFPAEVELGPEVFRAEVDRAVAELPAEDRRALAGTPVEVADLPALEDLTLGQPPLSPTILGLFRGPPEAEACLPEDGVPCRSIVLYRKNLCRFARDRAELDRQIRVTLVHELGHLRGEDDDELRDRGLQ
jgi:tetratricopeptide (TPR) repeat protein